MNIRIVAYEQVHAKYVEIFNQTLKKYKSITYPETLNPPPTEEFPIYTESYIALDKDIVCGGYCLKFQAFNIHGHQKDVGMYQIPVSLGVGDKRYADVGVRLLVNALNRKKELFCLGMGGYHPPLPRLLAAMRWRMDSVPFHFYVVRPFHFLRGLTYLRKKKLFRFLMDIAGFSGLGYFVFKYLQKRSNYHTTPLMVSVEPFFAAWADSLWHDVHQQYAFIGLRNSKTLNQLYPQNDERFLRLKISNKNKVVGWALILATKMQNHKQFGNLFVGTIADCLAAPSDAEGVIRVATEFLISHGVDLIVTNQSHSSWNAGLKSQGYLSGTSNFIFAASPSLNNSLENIELTKMHLNRGDNDGPIHL